MLLRLPIQNRFDPVRPSLYFVIPFFSDFIVRSGATCQLEVQVPPRVPSKGELSITDGQSYRDLQSELHLAFFLYRPPFLF